MIPRGGHFREGEFLTFSEQYTLAEVRSTL
jgi:hypothetical protein